MIIVSVLLAEDYFWHFLWSYFWGAPAITGGMTTECEGVCKYFFLRPGLYFICLTGVRNDVAGQTDTAVSH